MIIYLKDTIDALQTLIITSATEISNSVISIINCVIGHEINRLLDTQSIVNKIKRIVI